jgi:hypothetical protein
MVRLGQKVARCSTRPTGHRGIWSRLHSGVELRHPASIAVFGDGARFVWNKI